MNKTRRFYVYLIRDPRPGKNNVPIYIGKGCGQRAHVSLKKSTNPLLKRLVARCLKQNLTPKVEIVAYFRTEAKAFKAESALIKKYGRRSCKNGTLCNLTEGGEGAAGYLEGRPELRNFFVKQMQCLNADPAFKKAAIKRIRLLNVDPAFQKKAQENMRRVFADPKFLTKLAQRLRRQSINPVWRKAVLKGIRRRNADPTYRKKHAEIMRRLNADPKFRKICNKAMRTVYATRAWQEAHAKSM